MNKIRFKLRGVGKFHPIVTIDNQQVRLKKNELDSLEGTITTEKEQVDIRICTLPNEYDGKYWFWINLMYFIISVFGIFDIYPRQGTYRVDYQGKISVSEDTVLDLAFQKREKDAKALVCKQGEFVDNETNIFINNEKIKKRKKIMRAVKIGTWALISIAIILVIVL